MRISIGPAAEVPVDEVVEAVRYLVRILEERDAWMRTPAEITHLPAVPLNITPDYLRMVLESGFFDRAWHVTHNPDATRNAMDPLQHFLTLGAVSGCSPGGGFNSTWYTSQRPDLVVVTDPLRHYLCFGKNEGLWPGHTANRALLKCRRIRSPWRDASQSV